MTNGYYSDLDFVNHRGVSFTIAKVTAMFEIRMYSENNINLILITDKQAKELADHIYARLCSPVDYDDNNVGTKD